MRYLQEFYVLRSDPPFAGPGRYMYPESGSELTETTSDLLESRIIGSPCMWCGMHCILPNLLIS